MANKKNVTRVLISIIFIAYGIASVVEAFEALLALDLPGILACTLGILMFVMGMFGLFGAKIKVCRILGVIVCILCAVNFLLALSGGAFVVNFLVQALL